MGAALVPIAVGVAGQAMSSSKDGGDSGGGSASGTASQANAAIQQNLEAGRANLIGYNNSAIQALTMGKQQADAGIRLGFNMHQGLMTPYRNNAYAANDKLAALAGIPVNTPGSELAQAAVLGANQNYSDAMIRAGQAFGGGTAAPGTTPSAGAGAGATTGTGQPGQQSPLALAAAASRALTGGTGGNPGMSPMGTQTINGLANIAAGTSPFGDVLRNLGINLGGR